MKENKMYIVIISVLLGVLLVVLGIILLGKKSSTKEENITKPEKNPEEEIVYTCETNQPETYENFKQYAIENITVKNNHVLKTQTGIKYKYKTKEMYEIVKENDPEKLKEYDDNQLVIVEMNKEYNDYTKDETGKEINVTYDEYQEFLKNLGYVCKGKS